MKDRHVIFAPATPIGKSGVVVVRISGCHIDKFVTIFNIKRKTFPPRTAQFVKIYGKSGELIDCGLLIFFPAPQSFTGEDVIELHLHGSYAVVRSVLRELSDIKNFRHALPGEFIRRAYLNGKMTLLQIEATADLINANTDSQLRQAMRQLDTGDIEIYSDWRRRLIDVYALLESSIDFPDEDIAEDVYINKSNVIIDIRRDIESCIRDYDGRVKIRTGFSVVIAGAANVGKSTFMNHVAKSSVAIVSDIAGTTRDAVKVDMDFEGYSVTFIDTAGLRENNIEIDPIERLGIERSLCHVADADIVLLLFDYNQLPNIDTATYALYDKRSICIASRADSCNGGKLKINDTTFHAMSVKLNKGVREVLEVVKNNIMECVKSCESQVVVAHARQKECLLRVVEALSFDLVGSPAEIAGEHLREAIRNLDAATGALTLPDDVLDQVFSRFCIGK